MLACPHPRAHHVTTPCHLYPAAPEPGAVRRDVVEIGRTRVEVLA